MAIEGPITKVINIITAAQESSPNYISQALDKVFELLDGSSLSIYIYLGIQYGNLYYTGIGHFAVDGTVRAARCRSKRPQ